MTAIAKTGPPFATWHPPPQSDTDHIKRHTTLLVHQPTLSCCAQVQSLSLPPVQPSPAPSPAATLPKLALSFVRAASGANASPPQPPPRLPSLQAAQPSSPASPDASSPSGVLAASVIPPVILPSLRTLIVGELSLPPPEEPQPLPLGAFFPALRNAMVGGTGVRVGMRC